MFQMYIDDDVYLPLNGLSTRLDSSSINKSKYVGNVLVFYIK